MQDILITLPAKTKWTEYEKELAAVADGKTVMNFRIPSWPKKSTAGDKCFVCHRGIIKGYMIIHSFVSQLGFTCSTTGKVWPGGHFVRRTGVFTYLTGEPILMKGFQGYKYFDLKQYQQ
jgi:hypothetical protein